MSKANVKHSGRSQIRGADWKFDSSKNGQVAQLVEQRIENPRVGSSILPLATSIQRAWFNNQALFVSSLA
jgi:hypothetical protein